LCTCGDPTFTGIPCRHLIAVATKQENISYSSLSLNQRWKKEYYQPDQSLAEPERVYQRQNEELKQENVDNVNYDNYDEENKNDEEEKVPFDQVIKDYLILN